MTTTNYLMIAAGFGILLVILRVCNVISADTMKRWLIWPLTYFVTYFIKTVIRSIVKGLLK